MNRRRNEKREAAERESTRRLIGAKEITDYSVATWGHGELVYFMVKLIRRLTPLECERLQGFPDGWTDIPDASDSARYKAPGNSVAVPCVDFVIRGIAYCLRKSFPDW